MPATEKRSIGSRMAIKSDWRSGRKKGTYHVTATYRSGRAQASPNAFEWDGTNVSSGAADVYGPDPNVYKTEEFDITVPEAGAGEWVFTASAKAGPVIDKFEMEYKQPAEGILLDRESAVLSQVGEKMQLTATVQPDNAYNKKSPGHLRCRKWQQWMKTAW